MADFENQKMKGTYFMFLIYVPYLCTYLLEQNDSFFSFFG